jgi:hypothetical protein
MPSGLLVMRVDLSRWTGGFDKLSEPHVSQAAVDEWDKAVEVLFAATQRYAHVLSGDMVSTGRYSTAKDGDQIVGTVEYGDQIGPSGEMVDYVQYELRRKGSHDFFARGVRSSRSRLEEGAGQMVEAAFNAAFGGL